MAALKAESGKGCAEFLRYLHENYIPEDKKFELTAEMLSENQLKKTMQKRFALVFHPDKNENEERKVQVLRQEIMQMINNWVEQFKDLSSSASAGQ